MHDEAESRIEAILDRLSIDPPQTDLIVDAEFVQSAGPDQSTILQRVPQWRRWRSFIWAGGSFPRDLTDFEVGNHEVPRLDWRTWQEINQTGNGIDRMPDFADYTIQHPVFYLPPPTVNVSASVRYTRPDHWLVMRGEGLMNKDGPKHAQYPAHAMMLCDSVDFSGAEFCAGDSYIARTAENPAKPGTPTTWLEAGINHHITMVTTQLQSLVET